jgi:hypothetical protein
VDPQIEENHFAPMEKKPRRSFDFDPNAPNLGALRDAMAAAYPAYVGTDAAFMMAFWRWFEALAARDGMAAAERSVHDGTAAAFMAAFWHWIDARVALYGPIAPPSFGQLLEIYSEAFFRR